LRILFILDWAGESNFEETGNALSGAPLVARVGSLLLALLTVDYTAKRANDADKGAAVGARVAFRCALLVVTGATDHRVTLA
jgi:hypothetical protein